MFFLFYILPGAGLAAAEALPDAATDADALAGAGVPATEALAGAGVAAAEALAEDLKN